MPCYSVLCLLVAATVLAEAQYWRSETSCVTPLGDQGRCIALEQCRAIISLVNNPNGVSNEARQFIQQSQCGKNPRSRYPKVCCANHNNPIVFSDSTAAKPLTGNAIRPVNGGRPVNPTRPDDGRRPATQTRPVTQTRPAATGNVGNTANIRQTGGAPKNAALLAEDTCGTASVVVGERILGGEETEVGEFPWMALLQYRQVRNNRLAFRCGGVLISKRYVLTAAHCTSKADLRGFEPVAVRLGEYNKAAGTEQQDCVEGTCSGPVQDIPIEREIVHPQFVNDKNLRNDVALFRLASDVRFTQFIKPICLPHAENIRSNNFNMRNLMVAGWGRTEDKDGNVIFASSDVLKKVELAVVGGDQCSKQWAQVAKAADQRSVQTDAQICAGGVKGRDVCQGDSGGPLMGADKVARDGTLRYHVIGLVSYGDKCTLTEQQRNPMPGVYTRVSHYVDWILDQLQP